MIKEKIYNYFKEREKKEFKESKEVNFAPSYVMNCKRKTFYSKTGEPVTNPITEAGYLKMAMGSVIHEKLQDIIKDILVEKEILREIEYQGLKFFYKLDFLAQVDNEKFVIEFKTIYANGFKSIEHEPKTKDLVQLILYMEFEKIDKGIILYLGRDNGYMIEYTVLKDSKQYKDTIKLINKKIIELKKLKEQVEKKELPERDEKLPMKKYNGGISFEFQKDNIKYKNNMCAIYCQWRDICWKDVIDGLKEGEFYL